MNDASKPSPTPWVYEPRDPSAPIGTGRDAIQDANGQIVVEFVGHIDGPFIVEAVNSHARLLAERDEAVALVKQARFLFTGAAKEGPNFASRFCDEADALLARIGGE